jgi:hypothetical protein
MSSLARTRGAASKMLAVVLFAGILMLSAESSEAARHGGRGSARGGRALTGDPRAYRGDERAYRGGSREDGGRVRTRGRGDRAYGGADRAYAPGVPVTIRGGRTYPGRGVRCYEGGARYYGGARHYGSYGYRSVPPRSIVSFGIGLGVPYYSPPAYRYDAEPYPIEAERGPSMNLPDQPPPVELEPDPSATTPDEPSPVEREPGPSMNAPDHLRPIETDSGTQADVTNDPPAGCTYYDRFCDRQFSNLDEYTEHVESQNHPKTIEIVRGDSGGRLRVLEFRGGYWNVQR